MTQLDKQLEEIGLETYSIRWLADFLDIPRGRLYRAAQSMGPTAIGHNGRAAVYDGDTIVGLAEFLYGEARFNSWAGRLPRDGLERLRHHLGYVEEPQPQGRRPARSRDPARDRRTAEAEKMREEYDRKRYPSLYEDEPSA
ncbi:MAG: hypothetical protein O7C98_16550 [Planctomycetota bacterium]|nr:hypothetical protein [Planctomycetota bacterium]